MNKYVHVALCIHNVFMNALTIVRGGLQRYFNVIMEKANVYVIKRLKIDWIYIPLYILIITFKPLSHSAQCIHEYIVNTLIKTPLSHVLTMVKVFIALCEYITYASVQRAMLFLAL